jgi:hypothetical protein
MLSYTWGYTFGAIGSALMAFCKKHGLDPRMTHVWICCMCINQHRVAGGSGALVQGCVRFPLATPEMDASLRWPVHGPLWAGPGAGR